MIVLQESPNAVSTIAMATTMSLSTGNVAAVADSVVECYMTSASKTVVVAREMC
jgi:hypothetical protein